MTKKDSVRDYIQTLAGLKIAEIRTRKEPKISQKESVTTNIEMISEIYSLTEKDPDISETVAIFLSSLDPKKPDFDIIREALKYGDPDILRAAVKVENPQGRNGIERAQANDKELYNSLIDNKALLKDFFSVNKMVERYGENITSNEGKNIKTDNRKPAPIEEYLFTGPTVRSMAKAYESSRNNKPSDKGRGR